ncbi:MAG: AtpZ/AtpI family protein [Thermoguttaceae bacterium]
MANPPDNRHPLAVAVQWASHGTTIALEMVIPGVVGLWIDRQLGTVMVFLVLGAILGLGAGMLHLVRLAAHADRGEPSERSSQDDDST